MTTKKVIDILKDMKVKIDIPRTPRQSCQSIYGNKRQNK